jgi:hypothetical protein
MGEPYSTNKSEEELMLVIGGRSRIKEITKKNKT